MGAVGRTLIGVGTLLLLFVAYQLWGTAIQERRSQDRLERSFEARLATTTTTAKPRPGKPVRPTTTTVYDAPPPVAGDPVAQIRIPKIGLTRYVVEGVGVSDLKKAPGHYPMTPLPGQPGNAAIAGHRTTYGQPFYDLDELEAGDEINVRTLQGDFRYVVDSKLVVSPDQTEVLAPTDEARLTLTTCEPRFSARRRLIVSAVLDDEPLPAPPTTTSTSTIVARPPREPSPAPSGLDGAGLSGDSAARWPTVWWGLATALAGVVIWFAGRRWRRVWAYAVGAPFFTVLLYLFFENVSRLLPANI